MRAGVEESLSGVVAVALDEAGMRVLDALAAQGALWGRPVSCHRCSPADFGAVIQPAVDRLREPIGRIHLLVVAERWEGPDAGSIPAICAAIRSARQRYRSRIGRAILAVPREFQPLGEATRGSLETLTFGPGDTSRLDDFDAVVLLDTVNTKGLTLTDPGEIAAQHAAVLAHLTITDLAPDLHRQLENERSRLGFAGLFVSMGVAEIVFSSDDAREQIAQALHRRLVRQLQRETHTSSFTEDFGSDVWCEAIEKRLLAEKFAARDSTLADVLKLEGMQDLQSGVQKAGFHAGFLLNRLDERTESLRRIQDRAKVRLATFMDEFAPWYARFKAGKLTTLAPVEIVRVEETVDRARVAVFLVCVAGFLIVLLGSLGLDVSPFSFPAGLPLFLFLAGALIMLIIGFTIKNTIRTFQQPPPPRDMIGELKGYRACHEVVTEILEHHRAIRESVHQDIQGLNADDDTSTWVADLLELPEELIDRLLNDSRFAPQRALEAFWLRPEEALSTARAGRRSPLFERLLAHARELCAEFSNLTMNGVLERLGDISALDSPIGERLDRILRESSPWMPAEGKVLKTAVALPESIPPNSATPFSRALRSPLPGPEQGGKP
ncbi:MAG: hypothetical protein WD696_07930 [Bryobacteraceae bacterium]